ncbi:hypothetical protein AV530_000356 [Patagioenas fasciata monilis]|uniref:Uncharacterized protein n=1 Tax=Patagioenas fasciata monilis TaxID=372326 RepID=A0A1V4K9T5_PATFA|nr:hypothetical protein AV530_000356 [Patagioenas fasciata monilis]
MHDFGAKIQDFLDKLHHFGDKIYHIWDKIQQFQDRIHHFEDNIHHFVGKIQHSGDSMQHLGDKIHHFVAAFAMTFHFYSNGAKMGTRPEGSMSGNLGNTSRFYVPCTPLGFGGNFSCAVEENVGKTWVEGPLSNMVDITVSNLQHLDHSL